MPDGGQLVTTEEHHYDPLTQIQHYIRYLTFLHPGGQQEEQTLHTALRSVFLQEMEALLFYNGLQMRACYGNWQQEPLTATSRSMIYVCQRSVWLFARTLVSMPDQALQVQVGPRARNKGEYLNLKQLKLLKRLSRIFQHTRRSGSLFVIQMIRIILYEKSSNSDDKRKSSKARRRAS